ncbi:MAG: class I SAM-dependent methyltransferase [Saprospiraceae bacterium]
MEIVQHCLACQQQEFRTVQRTKAMMHPSEEAFNFDQCQNCGLVFLNPRVEVERLMDYYTDYYLPYRGDLAWGKYAHLVASSQVKMDRQRVALVNGFVPLNTESTVVDIGCGKPTFLEQLQQKYKCNAVGTDFSDEGWKNELERFGNLDLRYGEIEEIELPPADAITMWHYLEHDYAPAKTLQHLRNTVKNDTHLIIEVPNYDSESRQQFGKHWAGWHTPRHTALYTPDSMTTLLENNGWQVKKILTHGTLDPYNLYWMSQMEKRGIDWSKNMEEEFVNYVIGMIKFLPKRWKKSSLGVMTAVAVPA